MIIFKSDLYQKLISVCLKALPQKSFGLIAGKDNIATELYPMKKNLRTIDREFDSRISSYGKFYRDKDRGFLAHPAEQIKIEKKIKRKGQKIIAVYHSHRCRKAVPTKVDIDFHYDPEVYAVIVCVTNPKSPDIKVYKINKKSYKEVKLKITK